MDLFDQIKSECDKAFAALIILKKQNHQAIAAADVVLSKSGTVNLETALIGVLKWFYRLNKLTYWIGKNILRMKKPVYILRLT